METTVATPGDGQKPTTMYYDGACPICSKEVATYRRLDRDNAVTWHDVSVSDGDLGLDGVSQSDALTILHARLPDGRLVKGVDAFIAVWERLPRFQSVRPCRALEAGPLDAGKRVRMVRAAPQAPHPPVGAGGEAGIVEDAEVRGDTGGHRDAANPPAGHRFERFGARILLCMGLFFTFCFYPPPRHAHPASARPFGRPVRGTGDRPRAPSRR